MSSLDRIRKFVCVEKALGELKLLTRSVNTELTYLKGLKKFMETMSIDDLDFLIEEIKKGLKDANEIYRNFVIKLASQNLAPKTVAAWSSSLKKLFSANGINLEKKLPIKIYNIHEDVLPSKDDLRKILENASVRTKAIILFLLSSGLRVSELINLKLKDIELDKEPVLIRVKGLTAKERKSRITFISREAKQSLLEYLEKRKELGHEINEESFVFVTKENKQLSYQNLQYILNRVFRRISKKEGKRFTLHPHSLRKFFKTQMISAGVPGPIVDRLVGHGRYLANEYELYTEDQLREWYIKGESNLLILN